MNFRVMEFLSNVKSFFKAVFGKKTSYNIYVERLSMCKGCTWNIEKNNKNYCKECGCPKTSFWPFSELRMKCNYSNATCPRKKWVN